MADVVSSVGYCGQPVTFLSKEAYCFVSGNSLCIYELRKGPREMMWRPSGISSIAAHVASEVLSLAPAMAGAVIEVVQFASKEVVHTLANPTDSNIVSMSFSRDGSLLYALSGVSDPRLLCWSVQDEMLLFAEPLQRTGSFTRVSASPGNAQHVLLSGEEGVVAGVVCELGGSYSVLFARTALLDSSKEYVSDEQRVAEASSGEAVTFAMWLPFDYVILGTRLGELLEARFDGRALQVLRRHALKELVGASFRTFATGATLGMGSLVVACNTGALYWFDLVGFSQCPAQLSPLLTDTKHVLQTAQCGGFVSSLTGDSTLSTVVAGTRAGGLFTAPADIQDIVLDADADLDAQPEFPEPIQAVPEEVCAFQEGAVLGAKALQVPYDAKNSISCFLTASHSGAFHLWLQPFVESEKVSEDAGVRRSVPRQCRRVLSAQAGFAGADTVITSLEVCPFRGKGGTALIAVGLDSGWLELWELAGTLPEEDEGEGGDEAVRVTARKVVSRRFYEGPIDSMSCSMYPSSVSVTNVVAVGCSGNNVVHVVEVNNTANGFGCDVRCTLKVAQGNVAGSHFDGAAIVYVTSTAGTVSKWNTSSYASGSPLTFPAAEETYRLGAEGSELACSVFCRPLGASDSQPAIVGIADSATTLTSVEITTPDEPLFKAAQHGAIVICAAAAPNGSLLVTGCVDGSTYLWSKGDMKMWTLVNRLSLHADAVVSVCFSVDSALVLSCGLDGSVFLSTAGEGKLYKVDTRAMKINDRASCDVAFTNLAQDPLSRTWMAEKEERTFELLQLEHTPDVEAIKESLQKLASKHAQLVAENDARSELEVMAHAEFVVDVQSRDALLASNDKDVQDTYTAYNRQNMWNELTAARVRADYWDHMDQASRPLLPILSSDPSLTQYSMSVRAYSPQEYDRLDKVRRVRCLEVRAQQSDGGITGKLPGGKMRVGWSTTQKGCPEVTNWISLDGARWPCEDVIQMIKDREELEAAEAAAAKKGQRADDDDEEEEEEVQEEEHNEDAERDVFDENDIFNLLYSPQACQTQVQKRTQIVLLKEVSRLVCAKFNVHFDKLVAEKDDVIQSVAAKNERIQLILGELHQTEELFAPTWHPSERENAAVKVFDEELQSVVYESEKDRQKRLALEEEARRREAEKDAENIQGRALDDMMNGVLSTKKDMLGDDALVRPAWMDDLDPKDMSEIQLKELDEFDEKCRLIAEEQAKYKKALEVELKQLKVSSADMIKAFDVKLAAMAETKVLVQKELLCHELYITRLALGSAKRDAAWAALKQNEAAMADARDLRKSIRDRMDAFNAQTVEAVRTELNVVQEEERAMDKGFNRNLQDLTGLTLDQESLKVFKNLFKKRSFPSGGDEEEHGDELLDAESVGDKTAKSSASKSTSKKASAAPGGSKAKGSGSKQTPAGSKGGKENMGPMQEAAKALGADDASLSLANEDMNDPFYFALAQKEKAAQAAEKEIPLLDTLSIDLDCPDSFSVDQFTWSKLQELRTARIEKEIEAKKLAVVFEVLSGKLEVLAGEEEHLAALIAEQKEVRASTTEELRFLETNQEVVVCLKQGNDEIDKDAVVSDYSAGVMLPVTVIEKFNSKIKVHGREKINVLTKIRQFRRKINIIDWNAKHLGMQALHYEEYFTDLQLLRVTRDLQQVIRGGSDEGDTKQRLDKIAQRKAFLQKAADVKIGKLRKFNEGMRKSLKDKVGELESLGTNISTLKSDLAQRKSVQQSRNDARGTQGDASATATLKMKKVVQRRQLVDTARAQAEEIDYLRQELDKMRQRTFPSFAKLKKGH